MPAGPDALRTGLSAAAVAVAAPGLVGALHLGVGLRQNISTILKLSVDETVGLRLGLARTVHTQRI